MTKANKTAAQILAAITKEFNGLKMKSIEVPEWGLTIYFDPFNMKESREIRTVAKGDEEGMVVQAILQKAMFEDGTLMFPDYGAEERAILETKMRQSIARRIMSAMGLGDEGDAVGEAKKD